MPLVAVLTLTGAYSVNNSVFDLVWVVLFGVMGFFLHRTGFEPGPLVIGLVLGPELERGLTQGLIICNGSILTLISRPLSGTILAVGASIIFYNLVSSFVKMRKAQKETSYSQ